MKITRVTALLMLMQSAAAWAQNADLDPDRFSIQVGGSYLFGTETEITLRRETAPLGASVDFEKDLGLEKHAVTFRIDGYFRFSPHHRIEFSWVDHDRDGSRTLDHDITFGDQQFNVNESVASEVDLSVYRLAYTWSFYHMEKVELGLSLGATVLDYDVAVLTRARSTSVAKDVTAPLPTLGFRLDYLISPQWHFLFDIDVFYIDVDHHFTGAFDSLGARLEYRPADNISLGAGLTRLAADMHIDDGNLRWDISDIYRSLQVYVGYRL